VDTPRALWIDLGEENRGTAALSGLTATLRRKIPHAIEREKASCVVFRIQGAAGPGAANAADDLAKFIQELGKDYEVLTVAYVPGRAAGAYLYPVLACSQIVLGPEARLEGDPLIFQDAARPFPESEVRRFQESLPQLAEVQGYNPVLVRGLVDRKLEIWRLAAPADPRRPGAPPEVTFVAGADVAGLLDRGWRKVDDKPIKRGNPPGLLSLTADQALDWGLAYRKVEIDAEASVLAAYGIDSRNVLRLRADWLDGLVSVLVHPVCTVFLVIVAFTCLILEFKAPGMVVPAVVAAVCFVLLFWAHTRLSGEVNALAILLFLLGLVLLGIELLIIPGFGFTGIAGILLVLLGLALLVVQQWPTTRDEYTALGTNIGMFAGSMVAAIFAAYTVARYLPHIPYANKLVLTPPEETAEEEAAALAQPAGMLGAIGVAITTLRPAGKARFGDQFIDVVAEGYYVETGQRVQIIEIDGMRVVVKPV
jgi:hypothetical protein